MLSWVKKFKTLLRPTLPALPLPETNGDAVPWARYRVFQQVQQWVAQGYPVEVTDPNGGNLDGLLIYAVTDSSEWNPEQGNRLLGRAVCKATRRVYYIPTHHDYLEFSPVGCESRTPAEYERFLLELHAIPFIGAGTRWPLDMLHPGDEGRGLVPVRIHTDSPPLFPTHLPTFTIAHYPEDGLDSRIYHYGIDAVPTTAKQLRQAIAQSETLLQVNIRSLKAEIERVERQIAELRKTTHGRLSARERLAALLTKYPHYSSHRKLRRPDLVRHADLDHYQVPHYRDGLAEWYNKP